MRTALNSVVVALFFCSVLAFSQTYTIQTFAGGALPVNIPGTSAYLGEIDGVAVDPAGNVFIPDRSYNIVLRLDAITGALTLVAGNGTKGFSGDGGPATSAATEAGAVAVDSSGNLYIADQFNARIRKVTASTGVITTVAGGGSPSLPDIGDGGPATSASLSISVWGVAVDSSGNVYIADYGNQRIRKVTASTGVITTVAGNGTNGFSGDGGRPPAPA